jgi:hypothetical protein
MTADTLNPDCRDGKHPACNGDAWDFALDGPCSCTCDCHADEETAA